MLELTACPLLITGNAVHQEIRICVGGAGDIRASEPMTNESGQLSCSEERGLAPSRLQCYHNSHKCAELNANEGLASANQ